MRWHRQKATKGWLIILCCMALDASPMNAASAHLARRDRLSGLSQGIEQLITSALAKGQLPGCVVAIGNQQGILYQSAFGFRALSPLREVMTEDTIFDLASLTKPIATATSLLILADQGKLALDSRVRDFIPEFGAKNKSAITLRHLLTHVSGLPSEIPIRDFEDGREAALRRIYALKLKAQPQERFIYSDIGFVVLDEVIRRVTQIDLAAFSSLQVFQPLGMGDTSFLPKKSIRIAPTEMRQGSWIRGDVHDPRAHRLGGIAGHAGLFSTASDLGRFARMVLGRGTLDGVRLLSTQQAASMLAAHDVPGGIRALGWDMQSSYSTNRGLSFSRRAVGHGGYTGTSLWIDPEKDVFVVFLSNRVHPNGKGSVNDLVSAITTLVGTTFGASPPIVTGIPDVPLAVGIDVLAAEGFAGLHGLRFALLTNDGARNRAGVRTTDVLAAEKQLALTALLSPEHGLSANRENRIADGKDEKSGLPIWSLYGGIRGPRMSHPVGPHPVTLPSDIDAVVVDLPDVGARFFTYASTVHAILRAAAKRDLRVILLDRPNPLNGVDVSGPVLQAKSRSAVNHHPLPIRHGMTLGELAELISADEHLGVRLEIVRMPNYSRDRYYDELGLPWWPPSPNLQTYAQALLYPGVALIEGTNVSVGRGTSSPFEILGAPWMVGRTLVHALNQVGLSGITFEATQFTPTANPYAGQTCQGIRLRILNRTTFDPMKTGLAIATTLRHVYPGAWDTTRLYKMIGDDKTTEAILHAQSLTQIEALFKEDLVLFREKRRKYLLYPMPF